MFVIKQRLASVFVFGRAPAGVAAVMTFLVAFARVVAVILKVQGVPVALRSLLRPRKECLFSLVCRHELVH